MDLEVGRWYTVDQSDCTLYYCACREGNKSVLYMKTNYGVKENLYKIARYDFIVDAPLWLSIDTRGTGKREPLGDYMNELATRIYSNYNGQNVISQIFKGR